jgi:putative oxidoreductase
MEDFMLFNSQERKISFGLLIVRIGLSVMLLIHSVPPLLQGQARWKSIGTTLNYFQAGIPLHVLGLIALLIEALGALSLLSGYFFRVFCILLTILFGFYFTNYLGIGYRTLMLFSLGLGMVFIGLINTGPGKYAVSVKLEKK